MAEEQPITQNFNTLAFLLCRQYQLWLIAIVRSDD